jgi:hypothetical protein
MTLLNRWERWDPFAELNILQRQMDRLFRDTFNFDSLVIHSSFPDESGLPTSSASAKTDGGGYER